MKLYIEPCGEYPLHELDITDWLAKENEFDFQCTSTIEILQETSDAYLIVFYYRAVAYYRRDQYWLPKSQCEIVERTGPKG